MGTGIITTALLIIIGYIVITKVIGIAFRLVVPVVLIILLGGAGIFAELLPQRSPDQDLTHRHQPYGQDRSAPEAVSRLGDIRLRDIADTVVDATRSVLRHVAALLDYAVDDERPEQLPLYSDPRFRRDRFGDTERPTYGEPEAWDGAPRPGRTY
ncbi:hypothetical protein [Microvirga sp. TS319]|uniref:hypothetical protein n=1 Tax=Microvirga sp. TS319 TaxID=3241165 RepID=UPI00351A5084